MSERTLSEIWPLADKYLSVEMLAENMPGAFLIYRDDDEQEILFASKALAKIFECDSIEEFMKFTGGCFSSLVYPEDLEKVQAAVNEQVRASGGYDYVQYRVITKNGDIKTIEDWGHLVRSEALDCNIFYVYIHDTQVRSELSSLSGVSGLPDQVLDSDKDALTGLLNMLAFRAKAPDYINKILRNPEFNCYCIYFNVRNFHTYNEAYGFSGGDRMLKSIARILQDAFQYSITARVANDHFIVMTSMYKADNISKEIKELDEKIKRMGARINNIRRGIIVEMKAGIYHVKDTKTSISAICDCAKLACSSIRREYGTSSQMYDGKMEEKIQLQEYVLKNFQTALDGGNIKVFFQPVINVETGKIASIEALTRWEDKTYGFISPKDFIFILEEQRKIHLLDTFVIKKVCEYLKKRRDAGEELLPVSLNVSRLDFEMTDIVSVIEETAKQYGIPRGILNFEISESLIAMDMDALKAEADRLRKHGFKVWMDAFGSGYSSLKVLKDFTLDGLKIDMDMIKSLNQDSPTVKFSDTQGEVSEDHRANIIIAAVIGMAQRLGIPALSKGVETQEQLEFLKQAGCDLAQGYLFGKAMSGDDIERREHIIK